MLTWAVAWGLKWESELALAYELEWAQGLGLEWELGLAAAALS